MDLVICGVNDQHILATLSDFSFNMQIMEKIQERHQHSGLYLPLLKAEACFHPHLRSGPASWQLYPAHDGRNARRTKGKRESFKMRWGRKEGRGAQVLKGGCYSFLPTSLCWLRLFLVSFALHCCVASPPFTNLTFLIQRAGCELTCLENTVTFLSVKHTIHHALTWQVSLYALPSFARFFYCQQKMFN